MRKVWIAVALGGPLLVAGVGLRLATKGAPPAVPSTASALATRRAPQSLEVAEVLYDGKLSRGWDDWGWGPHQLGKGPAQVVFQGYGGILLHHAELPWQYGGLAFRYKAPPDWGEFMHVSLRWAGAPDDSFPLVVVKPRHLASIGDGWQEVLVDWKELNPERRPFDRVLIGSRLPVRSDWVLLDRIVLTKLPEALVGVAPERQETLQVSCDTGGHPISEWIYGGSSDDWSSGQSAKRLGGNPLTRLNWELGAWNAGSDWYFENIGSDDTHFESVEAAAKQGRSLALVVPMIGWVAKDKTSFGFPRAKFGDQRKHDPHKPEAGDGFRADGSPVQPGEPSQTSVPAPPALIDKWLRKLVEQNVAPGSRRVQMYILDNEPSLWNVTHRDVHPQPVSYDELLDRTIKYATVIRDADPDSLIAGPAEWGWSGYLFSAVDREAGIQVQPDRMAHGGVPLVAWYLKKLADHEKATGKRLLDVLDLHFYPAADGVYGDKAGTDPPTSELRLRSTRALWDPTYRDESWIKDAVRLIPRMKEWVGENYPGRKVAIGEWSFGAENHISGGLATAEALGRFGQHRLDAAFHWGGLKEGTPTYWAFRAFRNFDGQGGRFLDVSLPVKEGEKISLFASRNEHTTRLVLVLVNREAAVKVTTAITLQGCGRVASSRLFSYGGESKTLSEGLSDITESGVRASLPPYSFAVLDLRLETPSKR